MLNKSQTKRLYTVQFQCWYKFINIQSCCCLCWQVIAYVYLSHHRCFCLLNCVYKSKGKSSQVCVTVNIHLRILKSDRLISYIRLNPVTFFLRHLRRSQSRVLWYLEMWVLTTEGPPKEKTSLFEFRTKQNSLSYTTLFLYTAVYRILVFCIFFFFFGGSVPSVWISALFQEIF